MMHGSMQLFALVHSALLKNHKCTRAALLYALCAIKFSAAFSFHICNTVMISEDFSGNQVLKKLNN